jgi:hypothetical protein
MRPVDARAKWGVLQVRYVRGDERV